MGQVRVILSRRKSKGNIFEFFLEFQFFYNTRPIYSTSCICISIVLLFGGKGGGGGIFEYMIGEGNGAALCTDFKYDKTT